MFVTSFDPSLYSTEAGRPEADVRKRLVTSLRQSMTLHLMKLTGISPFSTGTTKEDLNTYIM